MNQFLLELENPLHLCKHGQGLILKAKLGPDFGHGPERDVPGVLELVLVDGLLFLADSHLPNLALEDLEGSFIPPDPFHAEVKELMGMAVDLSELPHRIEVFVNEPVAALQLHVLGDDLSDLLLRFRDRSSGHLEMPCALARTFTFSEKPAQFIFVDSATWHG